MKPLQLTEDILPIGEFKTQASRRGGAVVDDEELDSYFDEKFGPLLPE